MISIATDCSGIDAPIEALKRLKLPFKQIWYCDIDKYAHQTAQANHPKPEMVFDDMMNRDNKFLPHVDVYVCGFPCQSFSLAGKRLGTKDPRANVIPKMLDTIEHSKPKICILENVRGFMNIEKGVPCVSLIESLKKLGYTVNSDIYNTKNYGIPQNRERIYIVAIRNNVHKRKYAKPSHIPMKLFDDLIVDKTIHMGKIPEMYQKNVRKLKPMTQIITSRNYYSPIENISPTLGTSCREFYLVKYNRLINLKEALKLQGFPKNFKQVVSRTQFSKQIGNSMSVNVVKEIMKNALKCI